ncbi:alpha-S1-casein-like [Trichosurus vulpecula]|uniref:Alpha-S1-casein n=1 Tax=Trichosurus vulpecula TaxID=9337 RepID=Q9XSE3_TRIVU|nr:alpha-S1-casein-like [Trichosurus vulpecula]AAD27845.1 alpha-casein [Trichosurus vulpecula]
MKLLIFSCLMALALARPDVLHLSIDRHIKHREVENRSNEDLIPLNEVSSSEESLHQLNRDRRSPEKYELNKYREDLKTSSSEESVAPSTEESVRRQVEYNFNEQEDASASRERKIEDVSEQYRQYLRRRPEERALNLRYLEPLYYATEPDFYYTYVPISMPRFFPYPAEAPVFSTRKAPVPSINRATEAVYTYSEEKKN